MEVHVECSRDIEGMSALDQEPKDCPILDSQPCR